MNRTEFLRQLQQSLNGLAPAEVADILADYQAHFDEGLAAGRSEGEIAAALGDPQRLARELRAEARLRRWEKTPSPTALLGVVASLAGLLALDVLILLPLLSLIGLLVFVFGIVLLIIGVVGLSIFLAALLDWESIADLLAGIGLLAGSIGFTALLWLALEALVSWLVRYARLHFHVLNRSTSDPVR